MLVAPGLPDPCVRSALPDAGDDRRRADRADEEAGHHGGDQPTPTAQGRGHGREQDIGVSRPGRAGATRRPRWCPARRGRRPRHRCSSSSTSASTGSSRAQPLGEPVRPGRASPGGARRHPLPPAPAASIARTASSSSRASARDAVRTFSSGSMCPSPQRQHRLDRQRRPEQGRRRADPAAAAQVLQGVDVEQHRRRPRRASAPRPQRRLASAPCRGEPRRPTARRYPIAMPSERESTTSHRHRRLPAASCADSTVPDMSDGQVHRHDRVGAAPRRPPRRPRGRPRATAATCVTGRTARSAAATSAVVTSTPSTELDAVRRPRAAGRRGWPSRSHDVQRQVCRGVGTIATLTSAGYRAAAQPATTLTSFGARTMTVRIRPAVERRHAPWRWPARLRAGRPRRCRRATSIRSRTLPLTCTTQVTVSSTSSAGSATGNGS